MIIIILFLCYYRYFDRNYFSGATQLIDIYNTILPSKGIVI